MSHVIAVASGKGGVGKTLITASLAIALRRRGYTVLAVDADMGMRNLDLLLGVQDEVFFDVYDVMKKRCKAADALVPVGPAGDFLAASQKKTWEKADPKDFVRVISRLSENYDYVLIDCPPGRDGAFKSATAVAEKILFVVEPSWTSLRDAARVMQYCHKKKHTSNHVLFNNFYRNRPGYLNVETMAAVLLPQSVVGVLPHDEFIHAAAQEGSLADIGEGNPFFCALSATVRWLETGDEPAGADWNPYLPHGDVLDCIFTDEEAAVSSMQRPVPSFVTHELSKAAAFLDEDAKTAFVSDSEEKELPEAVEEEKMEERRHISAAVNAVADEAASVVEKMLEKGRLQRTLTVRKRAGESRQWRIRRR